MKKNCLYLIACLALFSCEREPEVIVPNLEWDVFNSPGTLPLPSRARNQSEGVYRVELGADVFGDLAPVKWTYTASGTDTAFRVSFFFETGSTYFICEGKQLDSGILLNGFWRRRSTAETGNVRLNILKENGGRKLLSNTPFNPATDSIIITGVYGDGNVVPAVPIRLRYSRPLYKATPFHILAHRGGGRTGDKLFVSENTVEIIKAASAFGSTGVEIDVRLTKDGVPVLYHDATLNERLVQPNGLLGPIENYTYAQLTTLVRLPNGEKIPTLRQALEAVLYNTPLQFVWLDTKYNGSLQVMRDLQAEYLQKAAAINRTLEIVIGLPDQESLDNFKKLPSYQNVPSLIELTTQDAMDINARVWAPSWTMGLQTDEVARMQSQGRKAFTWTMDVSENILQYMRDGNYNGILSNFPSLVAYHYYVR